MSQHQTLEWIFLIALFTRTLWLLLLLLLYERAKSHSLGIYETKTLSITFGC